MRVAHILNELKPSGAEMMIVSAAPHWSSLGVVCEVLATGSQAGPFAATMAEAGIRVRHVPVGRAPVQFWRLWRALRDGGYDVAHLHPEGRSFWLALTARLAGLPVVRTVHSNFLFDGLLRWRRILERSWARFLGVRFVAIAPGVQRNERERFANSSELIWNWLDTQRFECVHPEERRAARAAFGLDESARVIVTVGNCAPVKNHGSLIEALAQRSGNPKLHYLHVGLEDAAGSERAQCARLGIGERAHFVGWSADVRPALRAADLFVMPSRYEGLGNAAIEALALGLPVLLAEVPGLADLKAHFPSVRYCAPEAASIGDALDSWLEQRDPLTARDALDQAQRCRRMFDPARGAAEYFAVYAALRGGCAQARTA